MKLTSLLIFLYKLTSDTRLFIHVCTNMMLNLMKVVSIHSHMFTMNIRCVLADDRTYYKHTVFSNFALIYMYTCCCQQIKSVSLLESIQCHAISMCTVHNYTEPPTT